jgi:hypothetical protein
MNEFQFSRFIFDIVYIVFMELLFQNLVSGIMIDAFAELKANDAARDEDKAGMCYICFMGKPDVITTYNLDGKEWLVIRAPHSESFPLELFVLYILFVGKRRDRFHRN